MKSKAIFRYGLFCLLAFAMFLLPGFCVRETTVNNTTTLFADNTSSVVTAATVGDNDVYNALCRAYTGIIPPYITTDYFTNEYMTSNGLTRRMSSKYQGDDGVLELSYLLENAGVSKDSDYPLLLSGLAYFDMSDIKILDISGYKFASLELGLITFANLEKIVLNDCKIESINFIAENTLLKDIDLSNNNLTSIDLSPLTYVGQYNIDLSSNDIESIENITVNSTNGVSYNINLLNNNTSFNASNIGNVKYELGAQNLNGQKFEKTEGIQYFGFYNLDYKFQIYDSLGQPYGESITTDTKINLPVGKYTAKYLSGSGEYLEKYGTLEFSFIPDTPKAVIVWKDKEYETYKDTITGRPTIKVLDFEGKEIYYRIGTGEWNLLDETGQFEVNQAGKLNVTLKTVENGVESRLYSIPLTLSLNPYIPNLLLTFILLALFLLVIFGFVPLMRKILKK